MLDVLFPCNRKVFSVRANTTAQSESQAKAFNKPGAFTVSSSEQQANTGALLAQATAMHAEDQKDRPWRSFWMELPDAGFKASQFNDLLEWMGESSCKFDGVIHANAPAGKHGKGGYNNVDGTVADARALLKGTCTLTRVATGNTRRTGGAGSSGSMGGALAHAAMSGSADAAAAASGGALSLAAQPAAVPAVAVPVNNSVTLCEGRTALPQLYIVGMQKAGTSEVLAWLKTSKMFVTACSHDDLGGPGGDECHFYDHVCGWNGTASLLASPHLRIGSCPATFTAAAASRAAALYTAQNGPNAYACGQAPSGSLFLVDKSPTYSRLLGLPSYLQSMYGAAQFDKTRVVIIFREPLERMNSAFYQSQGVRAKKMPFALSPNSSKSGVPYLATPAAYAKMLRETLPASYADIVAKGNESLVVRAYYLDFFYRSLYALQFGPWLAAYDPKNVLVLPFKWSVANEGATLHLVSGLLQTVSGTPLSISAPTDNKPVNERSHLATDEALNSETRDWLRTTYFEPDTTSLASMIADATGKGLVLGGAQAGVCDTTDVCYHHLVSSW